MSRGERARPGIVVVVTGTGTDVGKTWWTAATATLLREQGRTVVARKPAQSFDPDDPAPRDADVLAAATGETPARVCPPHRSYPVAWAPPMAADELGKPPILLDELVAEMFGPGPEGEDRDEDGAVAPDVLLVETAGGSRAPLAHDGDTVSLVDALPADLVVVVADAGLGVIHAVRSTVEPYAGRALVVALNRYDPTDPLHVRNREWLETRAGFGVVTDPAELAAGLLP
ncbi:MAG: hypothetical protein JWL73_510 [Actinomycetia bacterium]|nr:hypothetical protein [Actinomycetes bacterium]